MPRQNSYREIELEQESSELNLPDIEDERLMRIRPYKNLDWTIAAYLGHRDVNGKVEHRFVQRVPENQDNFFVWSICDSEIAYNGHIVTFNPNGDHTMMGQQLNRRLYSVGSKNKDHSYFDGLLDRREIE
tara:strand:+ start:120 stop:509 length:390 start_codon:yes stop_codon:yes gene_type:complete